MIRIAEKLEFMNARAVKVCTKTANRRRQEPKISVFVKILEKLPQRRKILPVQNEFGKIVGVVL